MNEHTCMINIFSGTYEHYKVYHAYGPPRLKYMGYVGAASVGLFYLVRFTRPNPQLFDDVILRFIAFALFSLLALKDRWSEKLKPYYIGYSYFALLFCLPFFTVLTALQRGGGVPAISNAFIILSFLVLLTDWRNTLVMLFLGVGLAAAVYMGTTTNPKLPVDLIAQLPAFALIVIGGNLFKFSTEQIDTERKLRTTQALAGSIAHEMRNPFSQIKHSLEGMQQALPAPSTTEQSYSLAPREIDTLYRHLAESEVAVRRGLQVIDMTLDEVNAKPMDAASFGYLSAAQATQKAVEEYAFDSEADRARLGVRIEADFTFRGDETAYLFVLFNLIKNALYYLTLYPDARIDLSVGEHQVKVRDSGPGIAPEVLTGLFQPFRSVGKSGGTGLGLAYCRRVMRAFGGDIACQSELGQYTEFTLSFPPTSAQDYEAHRQSVLEAARAAFAGKRILIVDDDALQRKATLAKLEPLQAQLQEAADGLIALEALSIQRFDLVLLDLNMPLLDGYGVAERLRQGQAAPLNRDVRIVAYSSEPAHLASVKTAKAGMDAFVSKPSDCLQLLQALHRALLAPGRAKAHAVLAGRHIILADDNPYNRKSVAAYLRHAGATVAEAAHGQEVLNQLQRAGHCDAIVMDLNMPGMSGMETTQAIRRSSESWKDIPILALSAHSADDILKQAASAGMNDFITKPVDAHVLYARLRRLTGSHDPNAPQPDYPAAAPVSAQTEGAALDQMRLDSYRRIGMLSELLSDYLPELSRLLGQLEDAAQAQDLKACLDAMHSMLGISGEAGAQGLYRVTRSIYVPALESKSWPMQPDWLAQIKSASEDAQQALRAYALAHSTITEI